MPHSANDLRREISRLNADRARGHSHESTYGSIPSVIYQEEGKGHGNFHAASWRAICANPEWNKRLKKQYTGGKRVPRSWERNRRELDCANSSDALLMNVFCYPEVLSRNVFRSLLGVDGGVLPEFGFRPRIPLVSGLSDRTEADMRLGNLLVESKLTETGFQSAPMRLLLRYRDLEEVFETSELPITGNTVRSYQLIRGVLAAFSCDCSFLLLCDARRTDLVESWFEIMRAVRSYSFRSRLKLLTWQELSGALPRPLQQFLREKYGISPG